ncbi:hypothetical protein [Desulfovibrio sp.]|uniref:hypothetical protein n=1 Tax=Desulfovibrio sp. TaxID=885 RepID=UPI0025C15E96|nr:hypothetical protein [Desulfovibrio sp.]
MSGILEFYRTRFSGQRDVRRQGGGGFNGPCPLCGGEAGKSDRFMIWPDRRESGSHKRGPICIEHDIPGIWWCRRCGEGGDSISYLTKCEGMGFKDACAELGIEVKASERTWRRSAPKEPVRSTFKPTMWELPCDKWTEYASKLVTEAHSYLMGLGGSKWLSARGIGLKEIEAFKLGLLTAENDRIPGRIRLRSVLGLEPKIDDSGKTKTRMLIPRGIIIPTFDAAGRVIAARIRRPKPDYTHTLPDGTVTTKAKYLALEGSCRGPYLLKSSLPPELAVYFVVEAELDAMLIHALSGGVVGAIALRSNRIKPDSVAYPLLLSASRLLLALDYDAAGAEALEWWTKTFPSTARRWPTPIGKDPGDAFAQGADLRQWIAAALPPSVTLPVQCTDQHGGSIAQHASDLQAPAECGHMDSFSSGLDCGGGGASPTACTPENKEVATSEPASAKEAESAADTPHPWDAEGGTAEALDEQAQQSLSAMLKGYLPLGLIPVNVGRAALAWQPYPQIVYVRFSNGDQRQGFGLRRGCQLTAPLHAALLELRGLERASKFLPMWLRDHPEEVISSRNFLFIDGDA